MSNREFLIEVRVTWPNGESLDDWANLGSFFEDVTEQKPLDGASKISAEIVKRVREYCRKNSYTEEA